MMIEAVVFDLGGVMIDWDPRYLYRKLFSGDDAAMEAFLASVCTPAWNYEQDLGRPWSEAIAQLQGEFPAQAELIAAYHTRWDEMLGDTIPGMPELLAGVRATHPTYALTNWSAETFPIAGERFDFIAGFVGIVVSGRVGLAKPDPAIYEHFLATHSLEPSATLFIDDVPANVVAAEQVGFHAIQFHSAVQLRKQLGLLGIFPG